ncbi:hypothetical protein I4U23_022569 [Adineta vaga]|nr:hypothetical protein I4U23_022569 [Adineta vaga]
MASDSDNDSQVSPSSSANKHGTPQKLTTANQDILVYIPDLPIDCPGNDLEQKLRDCIEKIGRMTIKNIKCYFKLGIAVLELNKKEDQTYLLDNESMIFDRELHINISFVDTLNLDSYIVIDQNVSKFPSENDISRRYMQVYKTSDQYSCEPISNQFPNIFRIFLTNLDELISAADTPDFKIGNTLAQTSNAVVLATKSSKKWKNQSFIVLDGRNLSKKVKLAYRIIVSPIPKGLDINRILQIKLFAGQVLNHYVTDDHLIIELNSLNSYDNCINIGACRIDDVTMVIKAHTVDSNPDQCEISAENWYETEMLDIEPDIKMIMNNLQHPILHYKWNAQNWLEQFKKAEKNRSKESKYDRILHLLRVTVMLNTIAILRKKKYVVNGEEVTLDLQRLKTIGYDHKSKLFHGKNIRETDFKTPYQSTTVHVVEEDCLLVYEKLVSQGYRPLLLNMANATSPGGGYRKGDGAQEEKFKKPTGIKDFYPMDTFGAIYTSGITVFRQREIEDGYEYMTKPLSNVYSIAMAAYRDPQLKKNNMMEDKFAVNTHKKIENIFAIGYHHNHDCLVLSAFGCGAFKNPPEHVALLFKSVITQYAGYFDKIYFAIIDDHNAGKDLNRKGNVVPFEKVLDKQTFYPPETLRINGVSGPYHILNKSSDGQLTLSDTRILYKSPCHHGSKCRDIKDIQHCKEFSHPPVCSHQTASEPCKQIDDEVHKFTFLHNSKCKYAGECTDNDPKHLNEYDHPNPCEDGNHCSNTNPDHLRAYRHLPICKYGIQCVEYLKRQKDHCATFRHCKAICPQDNCCIQFHDKNHIDNTIHTFRPPCPFTPYNCQKYITYIMRRPEEKVASDVENHCLTQAHVCPYGVLCKTKDIAHYLTSIHIARQVCSDEDKCTKLSDYPGYKCHNRFEEQHLQKFRHGENHDHLSVAPSSNLNVTINFTRNQGDMIRNLNAYVDASGWKKVSISREILNWIRALQPVHRCNATVSESILVLGHVMSVSYMELLKKPKHVAKAVMQHSRIRKILLEHNIPEVKQSIYDLILLLVLAEFGKARADGVTSVDADHDSNVIIVKKKLKPPLSDGDISAIEKWAVQIALQSIKLANNPMGIKYDVDIKLETNKHVFSILGPHYGTYYGDIVITFKQEIMYHPDANFSIQAGTGFHSSRVYTLRPWWKDPGSEDKHINDFHSAKLHCSVPRFEYAAAAELVAVTGLDQKSMDIDLHTIVQRWTTVDSHDVFESHLPQLIPLDYIDNVYIPKNLFQTLSIEAQMSAQAVFKKSLILTDHPIDLSNTKPARPELLDPDRKSYLEFVTKKTLEKIRERMNTPKASRGFIITVPGTKFNEQIVIPITISHSYKLYCLDKPKAPNHPENTYIYWQVMNGDMMLTLSNETIHSSDKDQSNLRYVICYVAQKPSQTATDYHEASSYINDGHPLQHYNNVHNSKFKAKSNVFYRGCNTDDFFTFCLKLTCKTNEVTFSHAGPNGIYNHEEIHYQFDKSNLDLSRLDYIHVSGGSQDVPIRNLIIRHEKVPELHPTFDKDYKIDTSELLKQHRSPDDYTHFAGYHGGEQKRKKETYEPQKSRSTHISAQPTAAPGETISLFRRIQTALCCSSTNIVSPTPKSSNTKQTRKSSPSSSSSIKLPPCRDSIYCLQLDQKDHTDKYFHRCRFNEVCQNKDKEPHLVHERHQVPQCSDDKNCSNKTNPIHRAQYRHTALPDFLYPCRNQENCYNKSVEHRIKYFHGEEIPSFIKNKTSSNAHGGSAPKRDLIPCQYGDQSFQGQNQVIIVRNPSEFEFRTLQENYPNTLTCPCQQMTIPYGSFIKIIPEHHPICSSIFMSEMWINLLFNYNISYYYPLDFRSSSSGQFQILSSLCSLVKQFLNDQIQEFLSNNFLTTIVLSPQSFDAQSQSQSLFIRTSTTSAFLQVLHLIRDTTHIDLFQTALQTSKHRRIGFWGQYADQNYLPTTFSDQNGTICSCDIRSTCSSSISGFFDLFAYEHDGTYTSSISLISKVPGFFVGCYALESILQSSLECLFDLQCLQLILDYFPHSNTSNITYLHRNQTKYPIDTRVSTLVENLFLEKWITNSSFTNYYNICAPLLCTYSYVRYGNILYIITQILGFYGGLVIVLRLCIPRLVIWFYKLIYNRSRDAIQISLTERFRNLSRSIPQRMKKLNLFEKYDSSRKDPYELQTSQIITRIYLILLCLTMCILIIYVSTITRTQIFIIKKPSQKTFESLYSKYSDTMKCLCKQISIPYDNFISLSPKYHPICSSLFLSPEWVSSLSAEYLLPKDIMIKEVETVISQFQQNTITDFQQSLDMIRLHTMHMDASALANVVFYTSKTLDSNETFLNFHPIPKNLGWCRCEVNDDCTESMSIFDYSNASDVFSPHVFIVPGLFTGCFAMQAVFQSTLECFYNQTCLDTIQKMIHSNKSIDMNILDQSQTRFSPNSTLGTILNEMMLETWGDEIKYDQYYQQCSPILCSYTITKRNDITYIFTFLISLYGGVSIALRILISFLIRWIRNQYRPDREPITEERSYFQRLFLLLNKCKMKIKEYNLFVNELSWNNEQRRRKEIITTRIYFILLIISVLILIIFTSLSTLTKSITIDYPTQMIFNKLRLDSQIFPTLECPSRSEVLQFQLLTYRTFVWTLDFIREMAQGNGIISAIQSNWHYQTLNRKFWAQIWTKPYSYGNDKNCSCGTNSMCSSPAMFGNISIPGFRVGCYVIDSLLQSTLECLYNITCINLLKSLLDKQNVSVLPLNANLSSPKEIVQSLINHLFIDQWKADISYDKYYETCSSRSCRYSIEERVNFLYMITTIIGFYGGLTVVLKMLAPLLMNLKRFFF